MKDTDHKILARIGKLLAMSRDTSSPQEALIAAKRARKLMDKHQIDESQLNKETEFDEVLDPDGVQGELPIWMQYIATAVAIYNDCQVVIQQGHVGEPKDLRQHFQWLGFKADTAVSLHTYKYLEFTIVRLCEDYNFRTLSEKDQYKNSMATTISNRLQDMYEERSQELKTVDNKSLVVIKKNQVEAHYGKPEYRRNEEQDKPPNLSDVMAYSMGKLDGSSVSLDKQIGDDGKRVSRGTQGG